MGGEVQPDGHFPAVGELAAERGRGLVVEEWVSGMADGLGVVLEGEDLACVIQYLARCCPEPEAALLAAEFPDDCASAAVHPVDRPGEPGADQQVPVRVKLDRVDVEPVPGGAGGGGQRLPASHDVPRTVGTRTRLGSGS